METTYKWIVESELELGSSIELDSWIQPIMSQLKHSITWSRSPLVKVSRHPHSARSPLIKISRHPHPSNSFFFIKWISWPNPTQPNLNSKIPLCYYIYSRLSSLENETTSTCVNSQHRNKKQPCMWNLDFTSYNSPLIRIK